MSDPVSRETREWSEISSEGIFGANQCRVVFILQATYCPLPWGGGMATDAFMRSRVDSLP